MFAIAFKNANLSKKHAKALKHADAGQHDVAIAMLDEILVEVPDNANVWRNLGIVHFLKGNDELALRAFKKSYDLAPSNKEVLGNLASAHARLGNINEAITWLDKHAKDKPKDASIQIELAKLHHRNNDASKTRSALLAATSIDPNNHDAWYMLGDLCVKESNNDAAITYFEKARATRPGDFKAHLQLGILLGNAGNLDAAAACLDEANRLKPDAPDILYDLGRVLVAAKQNTKAIQVLERLLAIVQPGDPARARVEGRVGFELGIAHANAGTIDTAIHWFTRVVQIDPNAAIAWEYLGKCFQQAGDTTKANECAKRVRDLAPR